MERNIIICADIHPRNIISVLCYRHIVDAPSILKFFFNISRFYGLSMKCFPWADISNAWPISQGVTWGGHGGFRKRELEETGHSCVLPAPS